MATIKDWADWLESLQNLAPRVQVYVKTVDIPIDIPIPIPEFIPIPKLPIPDFSKLLEGLPEPPNLGSSTERVKLVVSIPFPKLLSGPTNTNNVTNVVDNIENLLADTFSNLLASLSPIQKVPSIKLPPVNMPPIPESILDLFVFEILPYQEEAKPRLATSTPGENLLEIESLELEVDDSSSQTTSSSARDEAQLQQQITQLKADFIKIYQDHLNTDIGELENLNLPTYRVELDSAKKLGDSLSK